MTIEIWLAIALIVSLGANGVLYWFSREQARRLRARVQHAQGARDLRAHAVRAAFRVRVPRVPNARRAQPRGDGALCRLDA